MKGTNWNEMAAVLLKHGVPKECIQADMPASYFFNKFTLNPHPVYEWLDAKYGADMPCFKQFELAFGHETEKIKEYFMI